MVGARRDDRRACAGRLADQLHQPRRAWSPRRVQQVLGDRVVGICDSPAGCAGASPARSACAPQEMWFDYFGLNHLGWLQAARTTPTATGSPSCWPTTRALGRLRGGPAVRRRLAARARDDPQRVPLLLLRRTRSATIGRAARAAPTCSSPRRRSTRTTGRTRPQALEAWRATRAERDRTYMAAERLAAGVEADHDDGGEGGGYEGEAMAVVEAIANNTRAIMILNTANRSALPFLDERAVVEVPCIVGRTRPGAGRGRARPRARAGARHRDQGRRAHDDRGGAHRLARAGGAGARAAPAGAERHRRARDLRRLPRAAPRARGALRG